MNRSSLFAFGIGVGIAVTPGMAAAQSCKDKPALLTDDWFLAKADCGVDKLLDSGAGAAADLGVTLGVKAVDFFIPGIADFLLGKKSDPFAQHAEDILNRIDQSKEQIISAMWQQARDQTVLVNFPTLVNELHDLDARTFTQKLQKSRSGAYDDILKDGFTIRNSLQNLENVFALDFLHTDMTVNGIMVDTIAESSTLEATDDFTTRTNVPFASMTEGDLQSVALQAECLMISRWNADLLDLFNYVQSLSVNGKFRSYSDKRFSKPASVSSGYVDHAYYEYSVKDVPGKYRVDIACSQYSGQLCVNNHSELRDPNGKVLRTQDGYVGYGGGYDDTVASFVAWHKQDAYRDYLLGNYGPMRPVIDKWKLLAGHIFFTPLAIDTELETFALHEPNVASTFDKMTTGAADGPMDAFERRMVLDFVLRNGIQPLAVSAALSASAGGRNLFIKEDVLQFTHLVEVPSAQIIFSGMCDPGGLSPTFTATMMAADTMG